MPAGYDIAIEILYMRLHSEKDRKEPIAQELVDTGRELLRQHRFASKNDLEGYRIGAIAKCCITGEQGAAVATALCATFKAAVTMHKTHAFYYGDLLDGLFTVQPYATLDALCGGDAKELDLGIRVLRDVGGRKNPLDPQPLADYGEGVGEGHLLFPRPLDAWLRSVLLWRHQVQAHCHAV